MVWAAFTASGTLDLRFVSSRMNSEDYQETLAASLVPFLKKNKRTNWTFQQDNASIHKSRSTKAWFLTNNVTVLDWPALSPDLNPMENLWAIMAQQLFSDGKQYETVESLKKAILSVWKKVKVKTLKTLVESMPKRIASVIENKGGKTKY